MDGESRPDEASADVVLRFAGIRIERDADSVGARGPVPLPLHRFRPGSSRHEGVLSVVPVGTANTTVTVELLDTGVVLTPPTMPSGMVTFVITNKCEALPNICSFHLEGIKAGAHLNPGQSGTWTVALPAGIYHYHCDLAPGYMFGEFTVTP